MRYFTIASSLFKFAPIFKVVPGGVVIYPPLTGIPGGESRGKPFGFDPHALFAECGVGHSDAFAVAESCRYGKGSLGALPLPAHPFIEGKTLGHGQVLDFEMCPVALYTSQQLRYYLYSRYMQFTRIGHSERPCDANK